MRHLKPFFKAALLAATVMTVLTGCGGDSNTTTIK